MRLEDAPQFVVWCVLGSRQGCSNLGWVMCIIVDNFDTIFRDSLVLEPAVGAGTACQTGNRVFAVDAEEICDCDNRQGIHDIVDTRCMQLDLILLLAFDNECVSWVPFFVESNICGTVIISCIHTEGNDIAVQIFCHMFVIFHIAIYNEQTVVWQDLCECLERICDFLNAAEEIEMIRVHIQDDTDIWMERMIAVCVFTGFCNEIIGVSHADIAADRIQHTTDGDGWIGLRLQQYIGEHGGCCCLAVRSADCDAVFVVQHDLTEELCPCQHRNISAFHFYKFRIVRMNGCGIYDEINIIGDIFCFLSQNNRNIHFFPLKIDGIPRIVVRACDIVSHTVQNLHQREHSRTTDSNKMDMFFIV